MNQIINKFKYYSKRRSLRYGLPFLVLMVGGSFGLKEFTHIRYLVGRNKLLDPEEVEKYGIEMKKPGEVTLETEFEKVKNLDIDNWEQIRGPRPWEEKIK